MNSSHSKPKKFLHRTKTISEKIISPVQFNADVKIDTTRNGEYLVYFTRDGDHLHNLMLAVLSYKKIVGERWPKKVGIKRDGPFHRLPFFFGESQIECHNGFRIPHCIFLSLFDPIPDIHNNSRNPSIFSEERTPIEDKEMILFRQRYNYKPNFMEE